MYIEKSFDITSIYGCGGGGGWSYNAFSFIILSKADLYGFKFFLLGIVIDEDP